MKRLSLILAIITAGAAGAANAADGGGQGIISDAPPDEQGVGPIVGLESFAMPPWFKDSFLDIEDDAIEAAEAGRALLVFFHLENCPYCAKMLRDSFTADSPAIDFIREHFDSIAVDVRGDLEVSYRGEEMTERDFARKIGAQYTPTIVFFAADGEAVLTINGYRSPAAFQRALDYVAGENYRQIGFQEFVRDRAKADFPLAAHPRFSQLSDLSAAPKPLAVVFEDAACDECAQFHKMLDLPEMSPHLDRLLMVRMDAFSEFDRITTPAGEAATPAQFARDLAIHYRPGIVFFDGDEEILRVTGMLGKYHLREALRYVGGNYRAVYGNFSTYLRERRRDLQNRGETVDYSLPGG